MTYDAAPATVTERHRLAMMECRRRAKGWWQIEDTSGNATADHEWDSPVPLAAHQHAGVSHILGTPVTLLADTVGMGKTRTAMAAIGNYGMAIGRPATALIVCPLASVPIWASEARHWVTPDRLKVRRISDNGGGPGRGGGGISPNMVCIVTYEDMRITFGAWSRAQTWDFLVMDEGHLLANPATARAYSLFGGGSAGSIKSERVYSTHTVYITGTPRVNSVLDVWSLMKRAGLTALPPQRFKREYEGQEDEVWRMLRMGVMLRRSRAWPLPPHEERRTVYALRDIGDPDAIELDRRVEKERREMDRVGTGWRAAAALKRYGETIAAARVAAGRAKIPLAASMIRTRLAEGCWGPAVVFAHHTMVLEGLASMLGGRVFDGSTSATERERVLGDFAAGKVPVLCVQTRAGGASIDLTAANYGLIVEGDWTDAMRQQMIGRLVRKGQDRPVLIEEIVLECWADARLAEIVAEKREMEAKALG